MTALDSRRRKRTLTAAMAGVVVLGAAPVLGYFGADVLRNSKAGTEAVTIPEVPFPSTPTAVLAVVNDQQDVTALAVMILAPGTGRGGTLVSIPTNASRAQTIDDLNVPVAASFVTGGAEGLLGDVESLSSVTLNFNAIATEADVATLLEPVGPLAVTFPNPVVNTDVEGAGSTLFPAGPATLSAAQAASVLTATDPTQPETGRLANVRSVWTALATTVGSGLATANVADAAPTNFNEFLAHFLAGPVQVYNDLNTVALTGAANPDRLDVGSLDRASVVFVMAAVAPGAMIAPNPNLSFRIENGLTDAEVAAAGLAGYTSASLSRDIIARLIFLQSNVVSVSAEIATLPTKVVPDKTIVFTLNDVQAAEEKDFVALYGPVEFRRPAVAYPLVDIVVVIGRSYLAEVKKNLDASAVGSTPDGTATTVVDPSAATVSS